MVVISRIGSPCYRPEDPIVRSPSVEIDPYSIELESTSVHRPRLARVQTVKQKTMENPKTGCHEGRYRLNVPSTSQGAKKLPEPSLSIRGFEAQAQFVPAKLIGSDSLTGYGYGRIARDAILHCTCDSRIWDRAWCRDGGAQKSYFVGLVATETRNRGQLLRDRRGIADYTFGRIKLRTTRHVAATRLSPLLVK